MVGRPGVGADRAWGRHAGARSTDVGVDAIVPRDWGFGVLGVCGDDEVRPLRTLAGAGEFVVQVERYVLRRALRRAAVERRGIGNAAARRTRSGVSAPTWLAMANVRAYALRNAGIVSTLAMAAVFVLTYTLTQTTLLAATADETRTGTLAQQRLSAPGLGGLPAATLADVRDTTGVRAAAFALLGQGFLGRPWPAGPAWLLPALALTVTVCPPSRSPSPSRLSPPSNSPPARHCAPHPPTPSAPSDAARVKSDSPTRAPRRSSGGAQRWGRNGAPLIGVASAGALPPSGRKG
ncbi:hypothetical protein [Streptomyces europaeiscabiei]|uniref:hypothetical protein n=1 Tax=Streptomyces europaeiscabiei TaxID=146819 RepID=UPI0029C05757|nr:hypothetical protein [Streptomyces europaeiscabiei]